MKIRLKYLLFFGTALLGSLGVFIFIAFRAYSTDKIDFVKDKASQDVLVLSQRVGEMVRTQGSSAVFSTGMTELFAREDVSEKFLVDKSGVIQAGRSALIGKSFAEEVSLDALTRVNLTPFATGLLEAKDVQGMDILVAYAGVPETEHFVLQVYQVSQVNRFLTLFIVKILFAFLAIGSFFLLLGSFAVGQLTRGLELLNRSAEVFGAGDFDHRVPVNGRDEVAALSAQFNTMAGRIQANLRLEEEKARLKMEMKTAQQVQETLFLPGSYERDGVRVAGYYEPASECGGDWWHYFEKGDSIWVCIGDVTGHGVGAAMLTSSVRAAFTFFEKQDDLTPSQALARLNQVVWESVGGRLNMTFAIIEMNRRTRRLRYASASHEQPMLLRKNAELDKNEVVYLMDANGPRMGQRAESVYGENEIEVPPGSRLICYSDGIYDVEDKDGKALGESRLLRQILKFNGRTETADAFVESLLSEITKYRGMTPLRDDVSLICVDFD